VIPAVALTFDPVLPAWAGQFVHQCQVM
jgi:hypothetical protein